MSSGGAYQRKHSTLPFTVPDDLQGRAYKDLTPAEHFEIKKYRMGRLLCEGCGHGNHVTTECRRLSRLHKQREAKGLCLECASPKHDWSKCPKRKAIKKQLGPIAKFGEVRPGMEGLAYKYMNAYEKDNVRTYRRAYGRCLYCGGLHVTFDCPKRNRMIQNRLEQQKRDIASGKLEIKATFTSTLAVIPVELRLQIWAYLTTKQYDIEICRGMLPEYMISSGLPFAELFEAWLRNNVFDMNNEEQIIRFDRMLTAFGGHKFVHSIKTPWVSGQQVDDIPVDRLTAFMRACSSLHNVKFMVRPTEFNGYWSWQNSNGALGITDDDEDPFDIEGEGLLQELVTYKGLRTVVLEEDISWRSLQYPGGNTVQRMIHRVRYVFEQSGRPDIEVDDGQVVTEPLMSGRNRNDGTSTW